MTGQVAEGGSVSPETADTARDIVQPAPGAVTVADASGVQRLLFKFPFASARFAVLDIDLVVIFDDGGKIIMPGLGLRMLSPDAPRLIFTDEEVAPARALASIGEVQLADQLPQLVASSSLRQEAKQEPPPPATTPPIVQLPNLPAAGLTPTPQGRASLDAEIETGSVALSVGRFVRRNNEESSSSVSAGRQEAELPLPTTTPAKSEEILNARPRLTSDGGGETANLSLSESGVSVTRVDALDPEGGTIRYAIVGGVDAKRFTINSQTGELVLKVKGNFESPDDDNRDGLYEVTIAAVDEKGAYDEQALTVSLADAAESPEILRLDATPINELAVVGQTVGQVFASDPDRGDTVTFSFAKGGDGGGAFQIDAATGLISVARLGVLDADTRAQENVVVVVTDQ
ncbi:MAG: cadherin repeat domain-containing protein, partial [Beijerinckiaceae bacterium]